VVRHTGKSHMRRRIVAIGTAAVSTLGLAGVTALGFGVSAQAESISVSEEIRDTDNRVVGVVKLTQEAQTEPVLVRVTINPGSGLAAGFHGFHIHSIGLCSPSFGAAGGHFNLDATAKHGAHAGDLPVLPIDRSGGGDLRFTTNAFDLAQLFDVEGSALIIHEKPDNYGHIPLEYTFIPTGQSGPDEMTTLANGDGGARKACAVLAEPALRPS
jgi:superoxide dismutase, Cu-Zn family